MKIQQKWNMHIITKLFFILLRQFIKIRPRNLRAIMWRSWFIFQGHGVLPSRLFLYPFHRGPPSDFLLNFNSLFQSFLSIFLAFSCRFSCQSNTASRCGSAVSFDHQRQGPGLAGGRLRPITWGIIQ